MKFKLHSDNYSTDYTSLYINVLDNYNERNEFFPFFGLGVIDDQVSNYNIAQLESNVIKYSYGHSSLSQKLKQHKPSGVTDAQIDLLISHY